MSPLDQRARAGQLTAKIVLISIFAVSAMFPFVSSAQEESYVSIYDSFMQGLAEFTAGLNELAVLMAESQTAAAAAPIKLPNGKVITLPDNTPAKAASVQGRAAISTSTTIAKPECRIGASRSPENTMNLWWNTTNATSITINRGVGAGTLDSYGYGYMSSVPNADSYTATVKGPGGSATCTTRPIPVISVFKATPERVASGGSVTITWQASGATSCDLYPASGYSKVALSGSKTFTQDERTFYSLVCLNSIDGNFTYSHTWKYVEVPVTGGQPVINGVSGPAKIEAGVEGTWKVNVSSPTTNLTYSVYWGDENAKGLARSSQAAAQQITYSSATMAHTYQTAGTYEPTFYVSNSNGSVYSRVQVEVEVAKPTIWYTQAKAAGSFEMDAGGEASLFGKALVGNIASSTRVIIGGEEATVVRATYDRIDIKVPRSLTAGETYDLYVNREGVVGPSVTIKILSKISILAVSAGPDPVVGTSTPTTSNLLIAKFVLTNKEEFDDIKFNGTIVQKVGTASDSVVGNVVLKDQDGETIGQATGLDSQHQAKLSGNIDYVPAGQSKTYYVYASVQSNTANAGKTISLDVYGILTDVTVSGTLPINGGRFTLASGNSNTAEQDARRVADINQLSLAVELYFDANGSYPKSLSASTLVTPGYISQIPRDPKTNTAYQYAALGSGAKCTGYHIGATLENSAHQALNKDSDVSAGTSICTGSSADFSGADPVYDQAVTPIKATAPRLNYESQTGRSITVKYYDMPKNTQIVFMNVTSGKRFEGQSTMIANGGSGSVKIEASKDLPAGRYYMRAQEYAKPSVELARTVEFTIDAVNPTPTCSLSSNKTAIRPGQSATLTWSSRNADSVTATPAIGDNLGLAGSKAVKPTKTTTYKLTFKSEQGKSVSCSTRIVVSDVSANLMAPDMALTASALSAVEEYLGNIYLLVGGE